MSIKKIAVCRKYGSADDVDVEDRVWFPAPTWWLTTFCHSSFRRLTLSFGLCWYCRHILHRHACRQALTRKHARTHRKESLNTVSWDVDWAWPLLRSAGLCAQPAFFLSFLGRALGQLSIYELLRAWGTDFFSFLFNWTDFTRCEVHTAKSAHFQSHEF